MVLIPSFGRDMTEHTTLSDSQPGFASCVILGQLLDLIDSLFLHL